MTLRVLVCGGRDYEDRPRVFEVLNDIHREHVISAIIQGGARGADLLGRAWATYNDVPMDEFKAPWEQFGKRAGPIRNARMIIDGKPDLVVAFPGGRGTADMIRQAKLAGIRLMVTNR